jgi:pimeloyl-ACP methyl ester carboxylesterase
VRILTTTLALLAAFALAGVARAAEPAADFGIQDFMAHKASSLGHGGHRAQIHGVTIYYETYGAGPPVLVLHGGTAFLETMHNQITTLAPGHLVIAPDSRAHGRSTDGPGPLHYHAMAEDMIALMDQLHIAKADLVGWSDGGIIGLDLAIHHPERIGRVVVIGTNFDPSGLINEEPPPTADSPRFAALRDVYRVLSPTPDSWPTFFGKVMTMWRTEPHYSLAQLGRIRGPVLVMAGEHDSIRRDHTDAMAKAIPGAKEVIIPDATHLAPLTHPDAVDAAITGFLAEPSAR